MHILLPPSETKRSGGGGIFSAPALSHHEGLREVRSLVRDSLELLCTTPEAAVKTLKLGVKNRAELQHNLMLDSSGAMPAFERYTGVLYDALDVSSLNASELEWLRQHVSVQSALFGLISAGDEIPAYRLSASSRLPSLGATLKKVWAAAHTQIDWVEYDWVLDLRSKDYVDLAPVPEGLGFWLHVAQRSAEGEVRALNHFNKAAKGALVHRLAVSGQVHETPEAFLAWAQSQNIEIVAGPGEHQFTLITAPETALRTGTAKTPATGQSKR
jgi:cytoplasmic iron level regulating protein YaaA (DUF328/UPF0246 family)